MREKRERRTRREGGREGNACQETIVFLDFNIHQANVKILIGPSSKHVNHSRNTIIRLAEINITLLSNLIDLSVIFVSSIKFDYRTQSNSIDAIGSILFGRKTKWYTKLISINS